MSLHERIESVWHDVVYAARGLARRPAFTGVAVLTLAIGIGATTAIFSAVNVLLLRPLPYARPDELMKVTLVAPRSGDWPGTDNMVWSYPKYLVFRQAQRVFSDVAEYTIAQFTITSGDAERIAGEYVGATYFRTLGLPLLRGHDFDPALDAGPGAVPQAILSSALWNRRFNADPTIIGRSVDLDGKPYLIVGVAPMDFNGLTGEAQIFVPATTRPSDDLNQAYFHEYWVVARRRPGITAPQAVGTMAALAARVNEAYPSRGGGKAMGARAAPLDDGRLAPAVRHSLLVLFGAVVFVLLIACVNVAGLLLGRANARRQEIAVRLAIGAGRGRLVRLLVTESVLLAVIGAVASIAVAWAGVRGLGMINPATTLRVSRDAALGAVAFSSIALDWRALGFALGIALIVGVLFGLVPAFGATRASLVSALKGDVRTLGRPGRAGSGRGLLVVTEVALAIVLLAGAGLMIRSLGKLLAIDPGFDAHNVLTLRLTIPPGLARDSMPTFYTQLLERLRGVPGVTDASISDCAPLSGGCAATGMTRSDRPGTDIQHSPSIGIHWVSPTWFSTMRVPLERGRGFTNADRLGVPRVIVINRRAAQVFFPGEDPIGKHVSVGQGGLDDAEVIGIVGGVRQKADSAPMPEAYTSYLQSPRPLMIIFVRARRNAASLVPEVRAAIREIAPHYPVYDVQTQEQRDASATARTRFSAMLLGLFAATALSLAAIGLYGVLSLAVTARTREIGIRMALGAEQRRVRRLVIGQGMTLVTIGACFGVAGALASTRVLGSLLFDLDPTDPGTYATVLFVLAVVTVAASWIPARRASRVDPVTALRAD